MINFALLLALKYLVRTADSVEIMEAFITAQYSVYRSINGYAINVPVG